MRMRHHVVITLIVLCAAALAALMLIRPGGFSTRVNPSAPERVLARTVRRLAVPRSGRDALNPIPFSPDVWARGAPILRIKAFYAIWDPKRPQGAQEPPRIPAGFSCVEWSGREDLNRPLGPEPSVLARHSQAFMRSRLPTGH
jgi:hypothetical protein